MSRFADTSYFLALLIPNDENHAAAVALASEWRGKLVTTDFVLIELGNHLSPRGSRAVCADFSVRSRKNPALRLFRHYDNGLIGDCRYMTPGPTRTGH